MAARRKPAAGWPSQHDRKCDRDQELRVAPEELPMRDPLACVRDEFNAVVIRSRAAGEITLIGRGAGAGPTASAVVSDVIATRSAERHGRS